MRSGGDLWRRRHSQAELACRHTAAACDLIHSISVFTYLEWKKGRIYSKSTLQARRRRAARPRDSRSLHQTCFNETGIWDNCAVMFPHDICIAPVGETWSLVGGGHSRVQRIQHQSTSVWTWLHLKEWISTPSCVRRAVFLSRDNLWPCVVRHQFCLTWSENSSIKRPLFVIVSPQTNLSPPRSLAFRYPAQGYCISFSCSCEWWLVTTRVPACSGLNSRLCSKHPWAQNP